tara:strand:+ start:401 stop:874 length:474 start_codon:yes stop_codon:yes gene_type:complete
MSFVKDKDTDNYYSNFQVWDRIKQFIPKDKVIWDPFYGDGQSGSDMETLGFNVIHKDIDFFENNLGDVLISNMPFSKRRVIFERLKELGKPFIMVGLSSYLSNKWFMNLFGDGIQVIIPMKRISFYHIENKLENYTCRGGAWYYCYNMNLKKDITLI